MTSIDPSTLDEAAELAAAAAGSATGVHALGGLLDRASDAVRERVGLAGTAPGVKVDADRAGTMTATISLVVDYPHKLHEVSDAVRAAVRAALEPLGRGHVSVDVIVTGVFGPFDRDVVAEAEEKADAVSARASEAIGDLKAKGQDAVARASAVVDDAKAATKKIAAGAAASADETTKAARERVAATDAQADTAAADRVTERLEPERSAQDAPDRADVRGVVAEALEDAAIDIAIAADDVRVDGQTSAIDDVQSLVEHERPRP